MRALDLTGKRYGRLIAIKPLDKRVDGRVCWEFICDCGKSKVACGRDVVTGHVKSCGCYRKEVERELGRSGYKGCNDLSSTYWSNTKKGAKERNLEFSITIEYAWELLEKQNFECALSGLPISCSREYSKNPTSQIASLDRIDSTKGYIVGNVQWTHKIINCMKNNYSNEEFISICKKVNDYMNSVKK